MQQEIFHAAFLRRWFGLQVAKMYWISAKGNSNVQVMKVIIVVVDEK